MESPLRPSSKIQSFQGDKWEVFNYFTPYDLVDEVDHDSRFDNLSSRKDRDSWAGSKSWEEFKQILEVGENVEIISDIRENVVEMANIEVESLVHDVQGSYVDIGRFVDGEPEHMVEFADQEEMVKHCTIVFNGAELCDVSNDEMTKKAAMAASLVDILENRKVRCQLFCIYPSTRIGGHTKSGYDPIVVVKVKDYTQPLHINTLNVFHTSFFRRGIFAFIEMVCQFNPPPGYGGNPHWKISEVGPELREMLDIDEVESIITLDSLGKEHTLRSALRSEDWKKVADYLDAFIKKI